MMIEECEFVNTRCFSPQTLIEMEIENTTSRWKTRTTRTQDPSYIYREQPHHLTHEEKFPQDLEELRKRVDCMERMLDRCIQVMKRWHQFMD